MFIIPIGRKPDWRRPPVVTLLLILVNCFVFFGPQSRDFEAAQDAITYYGESHLPKIEFPRYRRFLNDSGRSEAAKALESSGFATKLATGAIALTIGMVVKEIIAWFLK